jgi:hypothetical protein
VKSVQPHHTFYSFSTTNFEVIGVAMMFGVVELPWDGVCLNVESAIGHSVERVIRVIRLLGLFGLLD